MKNKATPTLHDYDQPNAALAGDNSGARQIFKLGLDVDLNNAVTAIQCGAGDIKRGQSFSRARLLGWVRTQVNAGHTVHTVYEACGFGYTLHHELVGAGANSLVTTPMRHRAQRRRKNDRMDARELCVRLARWLDGHRDELKPIRIPSSEEQQRRELGRQREFFKRELRRLENHGRALRIEFEHETLPSGWAGPRKWKRLSLQCSSFVREQLEPLVTQIRACRAQPVKLSAALEARVAEQMIPTGLGSLTLALLDGEILTGIVLNIAKPSAVTPAVALANIPVGECSASDQSIGRAINMCACSWSKPSGVCSNGSQGGMPGRSISPDSSMALR